MDRSGGTKLLASRSHGENQHASKHGLELFTL
jgi:hypothetical protein